MSEPTEIFHGGEGKEVGPGMESGSCTRAISHYTAERHRAAVYRRVLEQRAHRAISLCLLRHAFVRVGYEVRRRLRLAELLRARRRRQRTHRRGQQSPDAAHRSHVCCVRRASGARVRRWPATDRTALLHELGIAQVRAEGLNGTLARATMRVLLAEDDPMIGASVRRGLAQDGFAVDWVEDGRAAQAALAERVHDALVLDLGLPRQAGLDVLTAMRRAGDTRPVLITTARDAIADRVAGLDAGADDYLVKPFDLDELAARLRALWRRGAGRAAPKIAFGPLELDPATREARLAGSPIELSPREFALLAALMARPGAILSRAQLEDKLYGWNESVESNTVEVHIHSLRKKLGADVIRN